MQQATPLIFAPLAQRQRLPARGRAVAGLVAAACLAVLVVAAYLHPDPAGVGTTTRLGMRPCGFLLTTGLPCAACGMTTSFNHFVRGDWARSVWAQPMGFLLAIATCCAFWASLYISVAGRPAHRLLKRLPAVKLILLAVAFGIAAWAFKIGLTLAGIADTRW